MPLDPHARRLLDMLAASATRRGRPTLDERRRGFENLMELGRRPEPIGSVENLSAPSAAGAIALRHYSPAEGPSPVRAAALVYFHGGGLFAGGLDTHDALCRAFANSIGCSIISVSYRLAPEDPFPAAIEDGCTAVSWVMAHAAQLRLAPTRIGVAGDSAGANIAAVVCQLLRNAPGPPPAVQLLLCPILDWQADTHSRRTFGSGYLIDTSDLALELAEYLPAGADPTDARISPLRSPELGGLPITYIHTAEFDPLRDEGGAYADRLRSAKIPVHYTCHAGMIHMFYALPKLIPYASTALRTIGAQLAYDWSRSA